VHDAPELAPTQVAYVRSHMYATTQARLSSYQVVLGLCTLILPSVVHVAGSIPGLIPPAAHRLLRHPCVPGL
jgi:hypothetical protein